MVRELTSRVKQVTDSTERVCSKVLMVQVQGQVLDVPPHSLSFTTYLHTYKHRNDSVRQALHHPLSP